MKYTIFLAAAVLFAAFRLAAADPKADLQPNLPNPDEPVEIRVTTGDANKEVKAKVGEIIVVELESYAADNYYSWTETPGRSDSVLEAEGRDSKMRDYPIGMVRVGDKTTFRYLVKAPGKTELTFGCGRPWEQDKPPVSSFSVKIIAEASDANAATPADAKSDAKAASASKTYEMTRDDNGRTLKVKVGDVIRVKLKSNRTTGYSWALTGKPDAKILKSGEVEYKVDEHPAGMVGVGGNDFCTFTALAPGKTEISLGYARPWEKDKEPAQAFRLTVEVEGAAAPAADAKAAPAATKEVRLNDGDNGKTVKVAVGGTVTLTLESNPTTGFSWTKTDKVDKDILKLEKNDYKEKDHPAGMVGVGGTTVIVYRALKKGKAKIDLTYMQPWEPDSKFNTDYTVTVEVE
ncbi:MAG: protease inhibitor I42 family protein [Lentisphaeria bacterium]|nr:protease inhibitor I42 family protein [Lentisphaeria bacterium]